MTRRAPTENRTDVWTDTALDAVEFLRADYRDLSFSPHVHETYAIGIIEAGGQWFRPERHSALVMPQGTLCVINPGTVHEGHAADQAGWRYRMFYPPVSLVARALAEEGGPPQKELSFHTHVIDDAVLYRRYWQMHEASRSQASLLERESRMLMFLRTLFARHTCAATDERPQAARVALVVKDFLHAYCEDNINTVDLAKAAHVSETQVIRAFTKFAGLPPHAYLIGLKVERARHYIRLGMSLAQASAQAGFADQSHLARHFKRITGQTPGQYAGAAARPAIPG
ncbi:AraC family transcriptional regulator [Undibacterium sp. TJN25]|uniref:AraC family transcriptional regulator n=1 Tax=Undibacterium sp. TJN25 TaxID=3413056 RepID=UPI003BF431EA